MLTLCYVYILCLLPLNFCFEGSIAQASMLRYGTKLVVLPVKFSFFVSHWRTLCVLKLCFCFCPVINIFDLNPFTLYFFCWDSVWIQVDRIHQIILSSINKAHETRLKKGIPTQVESSAMKVPTVLCQRRRLEHNLSPLTTKHIHKYY